MDSEQIEEAAAPLVVTLGKRQLTLELPDSFAARREITLAACANFGRGSAAALGLCCPRLDKLLKVLPYSADYSPLAYGGRLIDAVERAGLEHDQLVTAATVAYHFIARTILTVSDEEVEEMEGFTGPTVEGSTS